MFVDVVMQDKKNLTEVQDQNRKLTKEQKREIALAEDILRMVNARLCRKNIFLEVFTRIPVWTPVEEVILLETDGSHLFYNPKQLIKMFRQGKGEEIERTLLHIICHGIFGHFSLRGEMDDTGLIDRVMDYEVMRFIRRMGWENAQERQKLMIPEKDAVPGDRTDVAGSRSLYRMLQRAKTDHRLWEQEVQAEKRDNHDVWNRNREYHFLVEMQAEETVKAGGENSPEVFWTEARRIVFGEKPGNVEHALRAMVSGQVDKQAGKSPGSVTDTVRPAAENARSYREVLEQFFRESEGVREREDSIDRMLYAYGFTLYGNIALIEPEECCDQRRLHTIAIAIDTSGSTAYIMGHFLRETKNILHDICAGGDFEGILLLQCDAAIQRETLYRYPEELPQESAFEIRGLGGTDFRPVFQRLDELVKKGLVLDCLIYFTDGCGTFPDKKPEYPTFLVLPENELDDYLPEWAEKIYLDQEEKR